MPRKRWLALLAVAIVLVAGDFVYWRLATERLRTGVNQWMAGQAARGWDVGSGKLSTGGWPRAAAVSIPNLTLRHAGPAIPGDLSLAAAGITLSGSLFNPGSLRLSFAGPIHVRAGGVPEVVVTGDDTSMSMPLDQTGPLSVVLHASGVRLEPTTGAWHVTIGLLNAAAEIADGPSPDQTQPAATFTVSAEAIALPATFKWPLGSNVSSLSFDGRLNGPLPATREITRWAEAWRDGGGSLEITHLAKGWGPLGLTSSATLALDEQLQPMGSGSGRIIGYAETLDRLAAGGIMTKSAATAAKAVLSLMAGTTDPDEPASVDVPLTLQYRTLSMRQVPLVRLQELDWPAR